MIDVIAIDYDGTFTRFPEIWKSVLPLLSKEIPIICATSRDNTPENYVELCDTLPDCVVAVILCGSRYKSVACEQSGYRVVIWIDNDPRTDKYPAPLWWCRLVGGIRHVLRLE